MIFKTVKFKAKYCQVEKKRLTGPNKSTITMKVTTVWFLFIPVYYKQEVVNFTL